MDLLPFLTSLSGNGSQGPQDLPQDPNVPPVQPQAQAPAPDTPIVVNGGPKDDWHPHKRSLLGTIGDIALAAIGLPIFPFGHANKNRNVNEAMANFQNNPRQAIQRLAQIKGEEFDAAKLAGQEDDSDMKAQNYKRLNDLYDLQKSKYYGGLAANMMYSASRAKDPQAAWQAMREQVGRLDANNGTNILAEIPENPDLNAIDIIAGENIPAWRNAQILESYRNHDLQHQDRQATVGESTRHHKVTEKQGEERVGIAGENAQTSRMNAGTSAQSANQRQGRFDQTHQGRIVKADGVEGHGRVSDDGLSMIWHLPDGRMALYLKGKDGNSWVSGHLVKEVPKGFTNGNASDNEDK